MCWYWYIEKGGGRGKGGWRVSIRVVQRTVKKDEIGKTGKEGKEE